MALRFRAAQANPWFLDEGTTGSLAAGHGRALYAFYRSLLSAHPSWRALAQNNFVRGIVTGFGLVDVWLGIWEAVHYRDPGKK